MAGSRVYSISPSVPFLPTLAAALLDGRLVPGFAPRDNPLALASATVFLPTRRAARAFAAAVLDALGREATLLPRIVPFGDVDEDALAFAETATDLTLPPAVTPGQRRLVLARLVLKFAQTAAGAGKPLIAATPAAALHLADEMARLFDDMTIAGVEFGRLAESGFVPSEHDEHWQRSLEFLQLARHAWIADLGEKGRLDPTARRDLLLANEAERIAAASGGPVIAAGSTGTIPAVANLIAAIARRRDGAVVLPGLDLALDEVSFRLIGGGTMEGVEIDASPGHPQFGLKRLIDKLALARDDIETLGDEGAAPRERLLSEAFRPAATTDYWLRRDEQIPDDAALAVLAGITVVQAADPREEALSIALMLRETLERQDRTAALVTPDRALARRVAAELKRWDIAVDDSAGHALADTEAGRLALLAATAAAEELAPVTLLALLRHPLANLGVPAASIDMLEIAVLRGPRPAAGGGGLLRAIAEAQAQEPHWREARARLGKADWETAADVTRRLCHALDPLLALTHSGELPLPRLVQAHREAIANLGLDLTAENADIRALARALDEFALATDAFELGLADYADAFGQLLAGEPPVRPPFDARARIRILGPLEARLLHVDRALLGGLNEGTWPPETHTDAWLNRPMRKRLALDLPERRVGLAAHDFVQALGAADVVLTRAKKQNGVETVASRFLQRLAAVAPAEAWEAAIERGEEYLAMAREWEKPRGAAPVMRPAPTPPAAARPVRLSVTDIETLIRDPYSIYARDVLGLLPLDAVDADPGAAERGTILHEALAEFLKAYPAQWPADAFDRLIECGGRAFARIEDFPGIRAMWWPRFERVARWFVEQERERRKNVARSLAETRGEIELDVGGRPFRLSARADRIDLCNDGSIVLIDYKTGEIPTPGQAISGLAPQLPLEAAIARAGGFSEIKADTRIADIVVIKPAGGNPPGLVRSLHTGEATRGAKKLAERWGLDDCDALAAFAHGRLELLLAVYADATTPYHSIPRPKWKGRFGRYDHLARIKEWSAGDRSEE